MKSRFTYLRCPKHGISFSVTKSSVDFKINKIKCSILPSHGPISSLQYPYVASGNHTGQLGSQVRRSPETHSEPGYTLAQTPTGGLGHPRDVRSSCGLSCAESVFKNQEKERFEAGSMEAEQAEPGNLGL